MFKRLFPIIVMLFIPAMLFAQTPGPCEVGSVRWDGEISLCSPISIFYEPDPSGASGAFRFTGRFAVQDEVVGGYQGRLAGPVRWFVDGTAIGDSDAIHSRTNEYFTILLLDGLAPAGTVIGEGAAIHAEYLGDEVYSGISVGSPDPNDPNAEPFIAFKGRRIFNVNGGNYSPLKQYPRWEASMMSVVGGDQEFGSTIGVETTWTAVDYDQDVLGGRFYVYDNDRLLGTAQLDKDGEVYKPVYSVSTLGLGEHTFTASYVGTEGALDLQNDVTVTVTVPRRPLVLHTNTPAFQAPEGSDGGLSVCARTRNGDVATGISSDELLFFATAQESNINLLPVISEFDSNGCTIVGVAALAAGDYTVRGLFAGNERYLDVSVSSSIVIVPADPSTVVDADPNSGSGNAAAAITLIAPAAWPTDMLAEEEAAELGAGFSAISTGTVLQARVDAVSQSTVRPTGALRVFINGAHIASRQLTDAGEPFVDLGPFNFAAGSYGVTLLYSGDETFAATAHGPIHFTVDHRQRASFEPQAGLTQESPDVSEAYSLVLDMEVSSSSAGQPAVLSAALVPEEGMNRPAGIPTGMLVFLEGDAELGRTRVNGFAGSILLLQGLTAGDHNLSVEYRE